ncbi:hypothetical protein NHJ6243_001068 [Beauveria neobassiana]
MATPTSRRSWNLSMCTFIIDSVGRWTFAAWLIPIFLISFGESVPVIFIRVWVLAAPENMAYFAGYVGASIFATLATVTALCVLFYVLVPRSSTDLHQRAMGLQSGNFLVGLKIFDCLLPFDVSKSRASGYDSCSGNRSFVPNIDYLELVSSKLLRELGDLEHSVNALSRLRDFLTNTPTKPEPEPIDLPTNWPSQGRIEITNVTASYARNAPSRLLDVSLSVVPGNKVVITGYDSGKSSLFMSLLGFLECSGTIEIDGIDIFKVERDTLRSRSITISQDYLDLRGTVRSNLRPFIMNTPATNGSPPDDQVRHVLETVSLLPRIDGQAGLDA